MMESLEENDGAGTAVNWGSKSPRQRRWRPRISVTGDAGYVARMMFLRRA